MSGVNCTCRATTFPAPLTIQAALPSELFRRARNLGIFPDWRLSMLEAIGRRAALDGWRARDRQDLGVMLAEMGAYLADVVSLYDALVAGETYLRTTVLSGGRRGLVSLLGYRPRPAVAGEALLAAFADGSRPVTLPAKTAFRSGQFLDDGLRPQPPQIFELTRSAVLDPRINRLTVERVRHATITGALDRVLVEQATLRVQSGDPLVLDFGGTLKTAWIRKVQPLSNQPQGQRVVELLFAQPVSPPTASTYAGLRLLAPGQATTLWPHGVLGSDSKPAIDGTEVLFATQVPVRAGEILLFASQGALMARHATKTSAVQRVLMHGLRSTVKASGGTVERTLETPDIKVVVSQATLDDSLGWSADDVATITVYHGLIVAGRVVAPVADSLAQGDPVHLPELLAAPRVAVTTMLLQDQHGEGVAAHGTLDAATRSAALDAVPAWGRSLAHPVQLLGNVLQVSRGESVQNELLGTGNAALASQTFTLQKKPLTYRQAATASGLVSTLSIRVGGVLWREVDSFYGCAADAQVYIVRHDDEGNTAITFGGGARVPTHAPVVAEYRFGAGAAQPPAGSIRQLARPVTGLQQVVNLLPAFGGADAESPEELAVRAPNSALLLGRAVSLVDLEAAAVIPGVRAVRVSWGWDSAGLQPAAMIRYIGDPQLLALIRARVRELAEPDLALQVMRAMPQAATLALQVVLDARFAPDQVMDRVLAALYAPAAIPGGGGLLRAERLGPDGAILLSRLAQTVLHVEGVSGLREVLFNETPFVAGGYAPRTGCYWDFGEPGSTNFRIHINLAAECFVMYKK